jgi:predicted nucleotidyltransferase component of viral defense system
MRSHPVFGSMSLIPSSAEGRMTRTVLDSLSTFKNDPSRTINELRILVAMERVIARLQTNSSLSKCLVFKGGFVLLKYFQSSRFTRDVDALAQGFSKKELKTKTEKALEYTLDDGLWYGDFQWTEITGQDAYGGLRLSMAYQVGEPPEEKEKIKKLSRLHLDFSFDETPHPIKTEQMVSILKNSAPISWNVYPVEFIIAEKLEALFSRGSFNSRAKDIFDLNLLLPKVINVNHLVTAIKETFKKRPTRVPSSFFTEAKSFDTLQLQKSWTGVDIDTKKETFEKHWNLFLNLIKKALG